MSCCHEKKPNIGNGVEPSGQKCCAEGSTQGFPIQHFRSILQVIYHERPWVLVTAEVWRWLMLLLSVAVRVTARTVQGMARARSGQAPAWPLSSDRSVRIGSRIKRDFACTFTRHFPLVLVVLRSPSRLRLEGRTRTLSGPSPDLSPARTLAPFLPRCPA